MNSRDTPITKRGAVVTDDVAEQLAKEAEDGYDLCLGKRVGRPSLAGGAGTSPRVNFRVTPDVFERAAERAEREGKTISELAREALEQHVGG